MKTMQPRYSRDEFAQRGGDLFDQMVRPTLRAEDDGKFVAIDIESGRYEIDPDDFTATERLLARYPDAQIWLIRVGKQAAYRVGLRSSAGGEA